MGLGVTNVKKKVKIYFINCLSAISLIQPPGARPQHSWLVGTGHTYPSKGFVVMEVGDENKISKNKLRLRVGQVEQFGGRRGHLGDGQLPAVRRTHADGRQRPDGHGVRPATVPERRQVRRLLRPPLLRPRAGRRRRVRPGRGLTARTVPRRWTVRSAGSGSDSGTATAAVAATAVAVTAVAAATEGRRRRCLCRHRSVSGTSVAADVCEHRKPLACRRRARGVKNGAAKLSTWLTGVNRFFSPS